MRVFNLTALYPLISSDSPLRLPFLSSLQSNQYLLLSRSHLRLIIKLTGNDGAGFGQLFCGRRQISNREQLWQYGLAAAVVAWPGGRWEAYRAQSCNWRWRQRKRKTNFISANAYRVNAVQFRRLLVRQRRVPGTGSRREARRTSWRAPPVGWV